MAKNKKSEIQAYIDNIKNIVDLSESSIAHITTSIGKGYHCGGICELFVDSQGTGHEIYGWWSLQDGKVDISFNNN